MKWSQWLERWGMTNLKINLRFLEMDWNSREYLEMLTRIVTRPLSPETWNELDAIKSVYSLFPLTREFIRKHGHGCSEFTKIVVVVLNHIVRPFTAKWHPGAEAGLFSDGKVSSKFRSELDALRETLLKTNIGNHGIR